MKKSIIIALLMLVAASPVVNAVTFTKYSGSRHYYIPELSEFEGCAIGGNIEFNIEFPIDGSANLQKAILKNAFKYDGTSLNDGIEYFLATFSRDYPNSIIKKAEECNYDSFEFLACEGAVISQTPNIITYECDITTYAAMAPRSFFEKSIFNYFLSAQKVLYVSDIFLESKKSEIISAIKQQSRHNPDLSYLNGELYIENFDKFIITEEGITFVFGDRELVDGPGIYKISVPKDMLSGCLTHLGELLIN